MVFTKSALTIVIIASLSLMSCASWRAEAPPSGGPRADEQVEPLAGGWKTWVLTSGSQLRLPAPPDQAATAFELQELRALATRRDAAALDRVSFWDAGAPGYRWNGILADELSKHNLAGATTSRQVALMQVAIYDATIAAWDSKYTYRRPRPSAVDPTLTHRAVPLIRLSTPQLRVQQREYLPIFSRTTLRPSWRRRRTRHALVRLRACSTRAIRRLASSWGAKLRPSLSSAPSTMAPK